MNKIIDYFGFTIDVNIDETIWYTVTKGVFEVIRKNGFKTIEDAVIDAKKCCNGIIENGNGMV